MDDHRIITRRSMLGAVSLSAFTVALYSIEKSKDSRKEDFNNSSAELSSCLDRVSEILSKNLKTNALLSGSDHQNLNIELNYALKKIRECSLISNQIYKDLKNTDIKASYHFDDNLSHISETQRYLEPEETPTDSGRYQFICEKLKEIEYNKILNTPITSQDNDNQCLQKMLATSEILRNTYTMFWGLRIQSY